jgi:prevent-host-death family protein
MEMKMTAVPTKIKKRTGQARWRLSDAKARFSEVVKLAQKQPQRVTVGGEDAVVIVAAASYDREHAGLTGAELVRAFQHPALASLDLEREPVTGPLRDLEL